MTRLLRLRQLAEQQQFEALRDACLGGEMRNPAERALLALAQAQSGDVEGARRLLATLDEDALDVAARSDLATAYLAIGEFDRGGRLLEATLAEAPCDGLLLARLGWCRARQNRTAEAIAHYAASARIEPRLAVLSALAQLYLQNGQTAEAGSALERADTRWVAQQGAWPESVQGAYRQKLQGLRLELRLAEGRPDEAQAWLEEQADNHPEDGWCALVLDFARQLGVRDRHAQAEALLRGALERYPGRIEFLRNLAELAQLHGRHRQAAVLLRRAICIVESEAHDALPLWTQLSSVCVLHDPRAARAAAKAAQALLDGLDGGRSHAATLVELAFAAIELNEQHYAEAEARYRALIDADPCLVPALQALGQLLMQVGRIDEAVALFERVRDIDPVGGHAALIQARQFPEDAATLDRLEEMARRRAMRDGMGLGLLFQLAAAWDKRGRYDKAFALADEANAASRKFIAYDPAAHRQRCARIRHAFSASLFEHRRDCGMRTTVPVFVVGMPRSGTTLVEQILAGHSKVHGAGELSVIPQVIARMDQWEHRVGSGRRYPDSVDDLSPSVTAGIAANVLEELRTHAPDAGHIVDKLPHNFENIGLIKFLFPDAKIISVRRDPRDIALSNYFTDYLAKHGGMAASYHLPWLGEQLADHELMMRHWHRLFPGEILEVRYEDIVSDITRQAKRLLEYVNLPWESQVLDFARLDRPVKTASVWQVRQPVYASSKGRWRRYGEHIAPLIESLDAPVRWRRIHDMASLPEPGMLEDGVALYEAGRLDEAEYRFKQLLHHLPRHAAANFMVGLIYVQKGYAEEGVTLMERSCAICPSNANWRQDLARAQSLTKRAHGGAFGVHTNSALEAPFGALRRQKMI